MNTLRRIAVSFVIVWMSVSAPMGALAQEAVNAAGNSTGTTVTTGAPECTGAGCHQGENQGLNQGEGQGEGQGGSVADESGATPATAQGANQGVNQGTNNGIAASNTNTGSDSTNTAGVNANAQNSTAVNNTATDTTTAGATGTTGGNASNQNTGAAGITTGNAGIGVTQVKNDNTTTVGGTAGLQVNGHNGDHNGDLTLGFGSGTANLAGEGGPTSVRATNDTTGADSTNSVAVNTTTETINEIQNDGRISNLLDLAAITGQNEAGQNTGGANITTGNADVAATLVNLLNTTVINGNLWVSVADIFGDLNGNIVLPNLSALAAALGAGLAVDATNETTGEDSTNAINVDVNQSEETTVNNDAAINTTVNARAITGQNDTLENTGGGLIDTGEASVSASSISLANTTIEGGNWGLVIVNALNRWLGFLVGDNGEVRALSQEETIREIEARNSNTGSDSDNTIDVGVNDSTTTRVNNDAQIDNTINADAITGQNQANQNTGQAQITTGNANVEATAVNVANTTVKDGSLFIAVVNVLGDWFGDLLYGGSSLLAAAGGGNGVTVNGENGQTGAGSENTIDVNVDRSQETNIDNDADIRTTLNAEVDTGSNRTNRNTNGASVQTGDGSLALHSRALANLTGIALDPALGLTVRGLNDTTGFDSTNRIRATLNDERIVSVDNNANVSTVIPAVVNTGNNEASQNTIGGTIITGNALADITIRNLVNEVIIAMSGSGGGEINVDLVNRLTGALSTNENDVAATRAFIIDLMNRGLVNNLVNLLLNTGGNRSNENTVGGRIVTGAVCVNGEIVNVVNNVDKKIPGAGRDLTIDSDAEVTNTAHITGTTGNNEQNRNTTGEKGGKVEECPKVVVAPTPTPTPTPGVGGPGPEQEGPKGVGGAPVEEEKKEEKAEEEKKPRVAAAKEEPQPMGGPLLRRFPVAGGESMAQLLQGRTPVRWSVFLVISAAVLAGAWSLDRRARRLALPRIA
jgi:hypothetical protein